MSEYDTIIPQGFRAPLNTWFLVFPRAPSPNGILIGSAVLAQLAERPRYNGNNRPHLLLRTAMRPSNKMSFFRPSIMTHVNCDYTPDVIYANNAGWAATA